jgi:hypothetical protein
MIEAALKTSNEYKQAYRPFQDNRTWLFGTVFWQKIYSIVRWPLERRNILAKYERAAEMANENVKELFAFVQTHPNEFAAEELALFRQTTTSQESP